MLSEWTTNHALFAILVAVVVAWFVQSTISSAKVVKDNEHEVSNQRQLFFLKE